MSEIERVDRYTITVDGYRVRAVRPPDLPWRRMDAAGVRRFLTVMGCPVPPYPTTHESTGRGAEA